MSTKAKATLASTVLGTIGIVYFVHYQQVADKAVCFDYPVSNATTLIVDPGHASRRNP
jgi:hypothetical protein